LGILILLSAALATIFFVGAALIAHTLLHPPRKTFAVALARLLPTDPQALGLAFTERRFRLPDGLWSDGWVIQGANAAGPNVIFTHGWADSRFGALTWVPKIAPSAARIVVYDLRAHGDSPAATCQLGTAEAEDLLALIDQSDDPPGRGGDREVVLWGHSLGAATAITAAALDAKRGTRRVAAVVADGVCRTLTEPVAALLRSRRLPAFALVPLARLALAARLGSGVLRDGLVTDAAALRCPLLLLHGGADPICPVTSARRIAVAAGNGHFEIFEGARHGDLADVDPQRYRDVIDRFYASLPRPRTRAF